MTKKFFNPNDYIIYNNWFGICSEQVKFMVEKFHNVIIDNCQSFFSLPSGIASFYSPRKFFGLPDGGIAVMEKEFNLNLELDISFKYSIHLLKRIDLGAASAYKDYKKNNERLKDAPVRKMSLLTQKLLNNINFNYVIQKRVQNFNFLHKKLKSKFCKNANNSNIPMVYPFFSDDENLRNKLIQNKIYVATYWPELRFLKMTKNIIPLPIDQRYNEIDMEQIIKVIYE